MNENNTLTSQDKERFKEIGVNTKSGGFKRLYKAGLLNDIDDNFAHEAKKYWKKHYNKEIDPVLHLAYMNLTGKKDPRILPSKEMWREIIPFINDMNIRVGYSDKNIYDLLIKIPTSAEIVLKRVRGHYFNPRNQEIDKSNAYKLLIQSKSDLIIKPSDTDNSKGIEKLIIQDEKVYLNDILIAIDDLEVMYGFNFVVQKVIKQHPIMAAPHPASVNTLRMVTLRWNREIHYLLTFARFGSNEAVNDNAGTGGICVGVTDSGEFMNFAIDEQANVHKNHPSTNYSFENYAKIPNFEKFKKVVVEAHQNILHHDFVSWDIAVGVKGEPIFIEANYRGATWLYQLATEQPLFGDLTEEILQYVSTELATNKLNRNVASNIPRLKSNNKKLKIENEKLKINNNKIKYKNKKSKREIDKLKEDLNSIKKVEREYEKIKKELDKTKQSRSWKYTLPFRKISKILKSYL